MRCLKWKSTVSSEVPGLVPLEKKSYKSVGITAIYLTKQSSSGSGTGTRYLYRSYRPPNLLLIYQLSFIFLDTMRWIFLDKLLATYKAWKGFWSSVKWRKHFRSELFHFDGSDPLKRWIIFQRCFQGRRVTLNRSSYKSPFHEIDPV